MNLRLDPAHRPVCTVGNMGPHWTPTSLGAGLHLHVHQAHPRMHSTSCPSRLMISRSLEVRSPPSGTHSVTANHLVVTLEAVCTRRAGGLPVRLQLCLLGFVQLRLKKRGPYCLRTIAYLRTAAHSRAGLTFAARDPPARMTSAFLAARLQQVPNSRPRGGMNATSRLLHCRWAVSRTGSDDCVLVSPHWR